MDREEIEDLVYASLGRHLRVTCVLGLLFLGIGFVMGHLVAAQHTRVVSERWAAQAEQLTKHVAQVEAKLKAELAKVRELAKSQAAAPPSAPTAAVAAPPVAEPEPEQEMTPPVIVTEVLAGARSQEAVEEAAAKTESHCLEQVTRCLEVAEREKVRIQSELQPYLDRKQTIEATEVSRAVNQLLDRQVAHLKTLAGDESPVAQSQDAPYFRPSNISPISGQSTPPRTKSSLVAPLLPIPGDHATSGEDSPLLRLPNSDLARGPVTAEPSPDRNDVLESTPPALSKSPRRSIFLGRKPVAVSSHTEPAVR